MNGQKIWISRVDASDYIVLMARTTPKEEVEKRTHGLTMFLVDLKDAYDQGGLEIESNQVIQHPLAEAAARVQAAKRMVYRVASAAGDDVNAKDAGARANMSKFLDADAAFEAADAVVQTHGSFGIAREYDVERFFREARLA